MREYDIQYEIIECGDKKMIKTTYSAGSGTGFSRTDSAIYSIINDKLEKVLLYPNHEHLLAETLWAKWKASMFITDRDLL
ncbi:MAG TPA: hypothetical protein PK604_09840 [Acetivibrio clariflavus]|nr:hypothetical protein [Acetivibrio clariflavus]